MKLPKLHLAISCLSLVWIAESACKMRSDQSGVKTVVGEDTRKVFTRTGRPWSAFGNLKSEANGLCSASLVGPKLLLTAWHCVDQLTPDSLAKSPAVFKTYDGDAKANVVKVYRSGSSVPFGEGHPYAPTNDWALLLLDEAVGDKVGWFEVAQWPYKLGQQVPIWVLGYPGDKQAPLGGWIAYESGDCQSSTVKVEDGVIFHDCDIQHGNSGGPIFIGNDETKTAIIGIVVGEKKVEKQNNVGTEYYPKVDQVFETKYPNYGVTSNSYFWNICRSRRELEEEVLKCGPVSKLELKEFLLTGHYTTVVSVLAELESYAGNAGIGHISMAATGGTSGLFQELYFANSLKGAKLITPSQALPLQASYAVFKTISKSGGIVKVEVVSNFVPEKADEDKSQYYLQPGDQLSLPLTSLTALTDGASYVKAMTDKL